MRCVTTCLPVLLSLQLTILATGTVVFGEEPENKVAGAPQPRSDLYERFDPSQLGRKYLSRFDRHAEFGAVSDFRFTPPGHWFKTFRIKGNKSANDLKQLVDSLQRELKQLANESSVKIVATKDDVDDRPIAVLKALCPTYNIKISTIQGKHMAFRQGQATGDIDLFVFQFIEDEDGAMRWCVLCTVHEPEVAE